MMYNHKLVASLKSNGKILREFKDTVYLSFNSEYSILLKNLNTVRSIVNIFVDGNNVVPGGLVLNAGQEVDLERSVLNGNLSEGNRFKFIERTSSIEQHRGIKLEDGLIRIEFQFEKVYPKQQFFGSTTDNTWPKYPSMPDIWCKTLGGVYNVGETMGSTGQYGMVNNVTTASISSSVLRSAQATSAQLSTSTMDSYVPQNDVGITVPGGKSEQKFHEAGWFPTEMETHTIVLKLLGETADNTPISAPVTVKHKPKCQTCGRQNKATSKFCVECGTALDIF